MANRKPPENPQHEAIIQLATGVVRRLLDLGLPEQNCFMARDAVEAAIENFHQRLQCGEWEPK